MHIIGKLVILGIVMVGATYGSVWFVNRAEAVRAAAAPEGGGRGEAPPLAVDVYQPRPERTAWTASAVGTLTANESVIITSEAPRRLVKVHVEEGQAVRAGDLLFELDRLDLEAEVEELTAELERVRVRENRLARLADMDAVSAADFDDARYEARTIEAQIQRVKVEIDRTRITAPFDGRVGFRRASPGAMVDRGDELITLSDTSVLRVDFKLPERYANSIAPGSRFRFRTAANAEWVEATVTVLEPEIELSTRSLMVRGKTANPDGRLVAGAFVEVEVETRVNEQALMVPTHAVIAGSNGSTVFVAENDRAVVRKVELGERTADRVEVLDGLKPGESVVVSNLLRIRPNAMLSVVESP